ncbi:MAG: GntR family transcriptional regulator [Gammaproteobacteria bacterium]|nr:GntR family transcriptional regulator [Gammaproteobacteria bacterium]
MISDLADLKVTRNTITLRQIVLDKLRDAIISTQLKPGQRLVERELCKVLDVSRTSVREALRHLESEGLVQYAGQRGPSVTVLNALDIKNIYELRAALEGLAGELFCIRANNEQVRLLQETTHALKTAFDQSEVSEILACTKDFYDQLLEGSGNAEVANALNRLLARIMVLRAGTIAQAGRWKDSLKEMQAIMEAISKRDAEAARKACVAHVQAAGNIALQQISKGYN